MYDDYKPAGFWIRVLANLIDSILALLLAYIISIIIHDQGFALSFGDSTTITSTSENISTLIYDVVFIIIFTASDRFKGTPGKLACNIEVVNSFDMTKISLLKSIGRFFAYILSALPLGIGFMMAGWNEEKKALHDYICGTRVVYKNGFR